MRFTPQQIGLENTAQAIHFIAIGGIGMSALAEVLLDAGFAVQGSDAKASANTARLAQKGAQVYIGHEAKQISGAGLVVVSTAIKADNPELLAAKAQGVDVIHRGALLGRILQNMNSICVAGTHGKTTTTALTYTALAAGSESAADVGIINGGVLPDIGTNAKLGHTDVLVVESDESDQSFLHQNPTTAIITNIEPEHLEHYDNDFENQKKCFAQFANSAQQLVLCADDKLVMELAKTARAAGKKVLTYGFDKSADVQVDNVVFDGLKTHFNLYVQGQSYGQMTVNLPGRHYVQNTAAALAVAHLYGADLEKAAAGLAQFGGVGRRFNLVGTFRGATVVDDYGHHPTEIAATIAAAKNGFSGKVFAVIEPHRYSRLKEHMNGFATCAQSADEVFITPVYSAGEEPIAGVSHTVLAQRAGANVVADVQALAQALSCVEPEDVIMMLGAGSISQWAKELVEMETA